MIKNLGYSWMLSGKDFIPNEVEKLTGLFFKSKNKRGDHVHPTTARLHSEGIAILTMKKGESYWPLTSEDALLHAIEANYDTLCRNGVEEFVVYYTVGYRDQCNLEFAPEQLRRLTQVNATLAISCVELEEDGLTLQQRWG